jgi:hypothetical protein
VTIVSVAYVPEGIAMAADSRLTGTKTRGNSVELLTVTDNAQKLILLRNTSVGISFYGDAIINGKTVGDFLRIFDINEIQNSDTTEEVANKLKDYLSNGYSEYSVAFLVAGYDTDEPFVFNVDKNNVTRLNHDQQSITYGAAWRGEVVPINRLTNGMNLNAPLMPLKDAADFAEFIVDSTIKYLRFEDGISTCGGPVDLLVITNDYAKFLKHKILQP